ncbi:hypothetical protein ANABIO32_00060 [Rossellomorea marisflavi]|nr:hypothetical protein ANABIO32_00060 [Rossellomorea marisflavi]
MKDYSNYYLDPNEKIMHDGNLMLEQSLNGFEGRSVRVNDQYDTQVMIYNKYGSSAESRSVIGKPTDVKRGNVYEYDNQSWLTISFPEDYRIYKKAEIRICNNLFPIKQDEIRVLLRDADGNPVLDGRGRPQYTTEIVLVTAPCIVESRYSFTRGEQQIALAEDRIEVVVGYVESENLKLDFEFKMYGDTYRVKNIDHSNVINGEGILIISAERKV